MKDLWIYLSEDEPENQAPPQNLEQLIVMLTREGARRFVHIANFISYNAVKIPEYANTFFHYAIHKYTEYVQVRFNYSDIIPVISKQSENHFRKFLRIPKKTKLIR